MHCKNLQAVRDDARARMIVAEMRTLQLKIMNNPNEPTYTRANAATIIDYVFSRIPCSVQLHTINRTGHKLISIGLTRKSKVLTKEIRRICPPNNEQL